MTETLRELAGRLEAAAAMLERSTNLYDRAVAAHLRADARMLTLLSLSDRHRDHAEVMAP